MATPGIEIRWGKGFETKRQRDKVRENLHTAVDMALEGLVELGIPLQDRKRMVVHKVKKVGPGGEFYGTATGRGTMHLAIPNEVKWRTQKMCTLTDASVILHELIHCERRNVALPDSLYELAATEGLAYNGECMFRKNVAPWWGITGVVDKIATLDTERLTSIRYPFIALAAQEQALDLQVPGKIFDEWVEAEHLFRLGRAEIVGIDAVTRRLRSGVELGRLMMLPAAELLEAA